MRIFVVRNFFISLVILLSGVTYASQKIDPSEIQVAISKTHLEEILHEIEAQTQFTFAYNESIKASREVNISKGKQNLGTCLDIISKQLHLDFQFVGKQVFVKSSQSVKSNNQGFQVQGQIKDEQHIPLPGATVREKGTTNGTSTDFDGNFRLQVSSSNAIIEVTYIGYISQQIALQGTANVSIVMSLDSNELDEVMVVGYSTQKKANLTRVLISFR